MIDGASDLVRLFEMLKKLDVVDDVMDITEAATYAMVYMGHKMRISESSGPGDIWDDVSDEEFDIMCMCDNDYANWHIDKLLLEGDEDE